MRCRGLLDGLARYLVPKGLLSISVGCCVLTAGKTTLLDVLAGRKSTGIQTGDILVNGQKMNKTAYRYGARP